MATDSELIGRDGELARLRGLVEPPPTESRGLVVLGEAGMGKSVLLADAAGRARAVGLRVLQVTGRESEQDLAFAGLHQLLRPVLDRVVGLPDRQAKGLLGAFALSPDPTPPDALLTGLAVLTLLSRLSEDQPVLVVADDAQWLDRGSLDALAFAARRLAAEPLVLLLGARGHVPPPGFERDFPELLLHSLTTQDAGRLLDAQPYPPHGRAREQLLAQAAGNPMVLIELARILAADPAAGRRWAAEPLPPTERLAAALTVQYRALPAPTREALLLAAVADSPDLMASVPGLTATALAPAETAGLIWVDRSGPQFRHPLVRGAVYHAVPFAERAAAHLKIAETVRGQPDRYAWHLAAAALRPDERVASLLAETADQARRRGGAAAAARALERAAELSPGDGDRARRLQAAGTLAMAAGQADWVHELATRLLAVTADPDLRIAARALIGYALIWSNRHADALTTLIELVTEASGRLPTTAWEAIGLAGTAAYHCGTPASYQAVLAVLDRLPEPVPLPADWPPALAEGQRLWIRTLTAPFDHRGDTVGVLHQLTDETDLDRSGLAVAAWLLDESDLAVRLFREFLGRVRAPGMRGGSPPALAALQWACIDSGRWDEALALGREAADAAAAYKLETIAVSVNLGTATVLAARGELDQARSLLARTLAIIDPAEHRAAAARAGHAAGLAALAEGNHLTAYTQLSHLFDADGVPLHGHVSYLGLADLVFAAVRAERHRGARTLVKRVLARVGSAPGARLEQLSGRAMALLAGPADAEAQFGRILADPAGDAWPFERAQLQLDYGEWLRRQRRINDAKPVLATALETFRRLGAAPWTRRTEGELRACGVTAAAPSEGSSALAGLTAQQREIVLLAGRGLTNAEIGDRLFLSPRTVAWHLYQAYPKLGIAGRHQLRELIDRDGQAPGEPPGR